MPADRQEYLKKQLDTLRAQKKSITGKLGELKRENRDLRRNLQRIHQVLENIPAGVALIQEGKIVLANRGAWEYLGYTEEQFVGRDFLDFVHGDSAADVKALHRKRLAGKLVPSVYEAHMMNRRGERVCCEIRVQRLRYHGKRAFLASIVDVGKRREREKVQTQTDKREAVVRMASGINRELKQWKAMLERSLIGSQEAPAAPSRSDPESGQEVEDIRAAVAAGDRIMWELDGLSKREVKEDPNALLFDLKKIVREAVNAARAAFEGENPDRSATVSLRTYLRATSPVYGNPRELKQAISAVVGASLHALPPEGEIYVSTEEAGGFATVYVQDNGLSISEGTLGRIFDPYFITNGSRKGGLGLSLAHAIVSRHHGEIEVFNPTDRGATFTIKLPVSRKPPKPKKQRQRNCMKDSQILILSEEGIVRDLLSQVFTSKGGKVRTASTDAEGLSLLKKKRFDLVVADPNTLPRNLSKIIARIKQMDRRLPVALVNAPSEEEKFGADLVVGKPLDVDRILPLVSRVLASRGPSA